jgi:hypothetical protein
MWLLIGQREVDISVLSIVDYFSVRRAIAEAIKIDVRDLRPLLYRIEKNRDQSAFRDLNSQVHWDDIVTWGRKYRTNQMNRANRTPDEWSVKVREVSDGKLSGSKVRAINQDLGGG